MIGPRARSAAGYRQRGSTAIYRRRTRPTKRCPGCAEDILLEAASCRYCGRQFPAGEVAQAMQEHQARLQAAAWAGYQAELAQQQRYQVDRLRGRHTRRLVFGIILISFGAFFVLVGLAMFFTNPTPGNTQESQRTAAIVCGILFGLAPLAAGLGLLKAAKSVGRQALEEQNRPIVQAVPPQIPMA